MDRNRVEQLARDHRELAQRRDRREELDTDAARREEAIALDQLLHQIERECTEYCASYNEAFGAPRVRSEPHAETVVVRSQLDQQDTVVFRRTHASHSHSGTIEVHRYHYPEQPVDLPVGLKRVGAGPLTLSYRDRTVTPAALVLEVLSTFTEQIARAESLDLGAAPRTEVTGT
jgi:hypothetical protein